MAIVKLKKQMSYEILNFITDKKQLTRVQHGLFCRAHKITRLDTWLYDLVVLREYPVKLAGRFIGDRVAKVCSRKLEMQELVSSCIQEYLLVRNENNPAILISAELTSTHADDLLCDHIEEIGDRHITVLLRAYTLATLYSKYRGRQVAVNMLSNIYEPSRWSIGYPWHTIVTEISRLSNLKKQLMSDVNAWGVAEDVKLLITSLLNAPTISEKERICKALDRIVSPEILDEYRFSKWPPNKVEAAFKYWSYLYTNPFVSR